MSHATLLGDARGARARRSNPRLCQRHLAGDKARHLAFGLEQPPQRDERQVCPRVRVGNRCVDARIVASGAAAVLRRPARLDRLLRRRPMSGVLGVPLTCNRSGGPWRAPGITEALRSLTSGAPRFPASRLIRAKACMRQRVR